jgi:hypothetical protein
MNFFLEDPVPCRRSRKLQRLLCDLVLLMHIICTGGNTIVQLDTVCARGAFGRRNYEWWYNVCAILESEIMFYFYLIVNKSSWDKTCSLCGDAHSKM